MKLPNGYGSVYKLSGKRRKPWGVRKTIGWETTEDGKVKQKYQNIGYYATRAEAMNALAEYNRNPFDIKPEITFAELYEKWSAEKFPTISESSVKNYRIAYNDCAPLYDMRFSDIRRSHLQGVIDTCGKNYPMLSKIKVLFGQLFKYALENDIVTKNYAEFVDIKKHKKMTKEIHKPFTDAEIALLWDKQDENKYMSVFLMLLYSGVRISELLDLRCSDVHLDEQYFDVIASKTQAGIREVPIADKVLPFFKMWMDDDCEYLIHSYAGKHLSYRSYYDMYWRPLMSDLELDHIPHDTRHTTISLLARENVNQTIIKRIVGHAGAMSLTEKVYTHFEVKQLLDAINLI